MGKSTGPPGVEIRHTQTCRTRAGGPCDCRPSVRAMVYDARAEKRIRRSFNERGSGTTTDRVNAALKWRLAAMQLVKDGKMRAARGQDLASLLEQFLAGAERGTVLARNGKPYAPSTCLRMRQAAEFRIVPEWGTKDPDEITVVLVQRFVDRLVTDGVGASSVKNTLKPLSAMYRWALRRGEVTGNPCAGVWLPSATGKRPTIVAPGMADKMLAELRPGDQVLWGLGFYAGLRRSEALGLRWDAVDVERRRLMVERAYHAESRTLREVTKTAAGARTLPMPLPLSRLLERAERRGPFVVGGQEPGIEQWNAVLRRAYARWQRAGLERISYHASRHTYASWLIAAASRSGEYVDLKELMALMGHSSVQMTVDLYGHLLPDHLDRAQRHMDAFLDGHQSV